MNNDNANKSTFLTEQQVANLAAQQMFYGKIGPSMIDFIESLVKEIENYPGDKMALKSRLVTIFEYRINEKHKNENK